jgi:hypothetical protein
MIIHIFSTSLLNPLEQIDLVKMIMPTVQFIFLKFLFFSCLIIHDAPLLRYLLVGVKTERIRTDSSETIFVTVFVSDSESERIVCGYKYGIGVYR